MGIRTSLNRAGRIGHGLVVLFAMWGVLISAIEYHFPTHPLRVLALLLAFGFLMVVLRQALWGPSTDKRKRVGT